MKHMPIGKGRAARLLALALGLLLLGLMSRGQAAEQSLPSDLAAVPRDAVGFIHIRAAELWSSDAMKDGRYLFSQAGAEALARFEKTLPLPLSNIDRLTIVMQSWQDPFPNVDPEAVSALVIVRTLKPYSRLALMQNLGCREKVYRRTLYHFFEELWSGVYFIDEHTFMVGSEDALIHYFNRMRQPNESGPLSAALAAAAEKHLAVLGVNPIALAKVPEIKGLPQPFMPLVDATCGTFTIDLDSKTRLDLRLDYPKDESAQAGAKAIQTVLEMGRAGLAQPIGELEKGLVQDRKRAKSGVGDLSDNIGKLLGLGALRELDRQLKEAKIEQKGSLVRLPAEFRAFDSSNGWMMMSFSATAAMGRSTRMRFNRIGMKFRDDKKAEVDPVEQHLRKLADGLEQYRGKKGSYPSPATYDKDGRALLSWRVALLPYLGEEALYREFHLDEPWDSLHNKKLIKKIPKAFQAPDNDRYDFGMPRGRTNNTLFTGPGTIFEGRTGARKQDVAGKTILVLLGGANDVYWTKPADIPYRADKPVPELFGENSFGPLKAILVDGTVRTIDKTIAEKELRELIERKKPAK